MHICVKHLSFIETLTNFLLTQAAAYLALHGLNFHTQITIIKEMLPTVLLPYITMHCKSVWPTIHLHIMVEVFGSTNLCCTHYCKVYAAPSWYNYTTNMILCALGGCDYIYIYIYSFAKKVCFSELAKQKRHLENKNKTIFS